MLISTSRGIAFLSNPKCGTTSIERALSKKCEISMTKTSHFKHMNAVKFTKTWKPFLTKKLLIDNLLIFCTTRSPSSKIISWYKYRSRTQLKGSKKYLGSTPFRDFCSQSMQTQADKFFFDATTNRFLVDIAIPIENIRIIETFVCKEFGIKQIPKINTSEKPDQSSYAATMTPADYEQVIKEEARKASKTYVESTIRHKLLADFFSRQSQNIDLRSASLQFKLAFDD